MVAKVENFPTGTKLVVGNVLGHLTIVGFEYINGKEWVISECDCKDCNRNQIKTRKGDLKTRVKLYCNFEDCKYNEANRIIINDQEYSLLPGSIIGNLEIGERYYTGVDQHYELNIQCKCGSSPFKLQKNSLLGRRYLDCGRPDCIFVVFNNRVITDTLYMIWQGIKQRLFNINNHGFDVYNNIIGSKMQSEWINDFKVFNEYINLLNPTKKEMELLYPGKVISIDRINNNLGYIKGNLRWATPQMQAQNQRNSKSYNLINSIRWDYEVNKIPQYELVKKYNIDFGSMSQIVNYVIYSNISIEAEKAEYLQSKTINGLTEQQIIVQGGILS
jgi:hypothetical protein